MRRRTIALVLGAVALILVLGVGFLASYPFSYDTTHGADSDAERFTVELGDEFHLTGTYHGNETLEFESVRTATGERYEYYRFGGIVTASYRPDPDGELYELYRYPDESRAESFRNRIRESETETLVVDEQDDGDARFLVVDEEPRESDGTLKNTETILLTSLQAFSAFERTDADGDTHLYEPQTGWYSHSERLPEFRVTDASGQVRVEAGTNSVQSANVSVHYTVASSYLEYYWDPGKTGSVDTTIDVEEPPASIEEPELVQEIREQR